MSKAQLCALRISLAGLDWKRTVAAAAARLHCRSSESRSALDVWKPDLCRRIAGGASFADGWRTTKLWLGPGRHAVGVSPQRIYLRPDGSRDVRPEREIVAPRSRPTIPLAERLRGLQWFLENLQADCPQELGACVELEIDDADPLAGVTLRGRKDAFPANTTLRTVHEQGGFLGAPGKLVVVLCSDDGLGSAPAEDYMGRAEFEFKRRGAEARVRCCELSRLEKRLTELHGGDRAKRRDAPVLFMLATRNKTPTDRLRRVMRGLDDHGLPWRRAYADDDRTWSVADQVGSLLQAAGGHPHEVLLPNGESPPWSIGLDVSRRDASSTVAATLVSPDGRLAGAWTSDQARRENIDSSVLRRLLTAASDAVPEHDREQGMLVVRDGRIFESERAEDYKRDLGGPVSLVELRKHNNPPLLIGDDRNLPVSPTVGWFAEAASGSLGFLVTLPRSEQGAFGSVLKVWMRDADDGMQLGPERLARVLLAQTLTPGLGLHRRRLPAPIYWADGIAGASDTDLRFRGQPVVRLN